MRSFRTFLSLALPVAAATMLAAPAHADVKDGVDAWQRGDYPAAVAQWRPLAIAGDADAQFNLGQAYKLGRGVPADLSQAEAWYRRAADQGHLQAEDNLGLVLFSANRREEAMVHVARSAARGEPRAQYVLGTAHFNGDLAPKDWPRAYALTKRASDAGLEIAAARLAQLDQLIPLEQRRRGLAMLPDMERDESRARLAAVNSVAPPPARPAPSPIRTASLPASTPGTSYTPPPVIAPTAAPPAPTLSAGAQTAAAAAAEATAAADAAVTAAKVPGESAGTTYAAPPESGKLPPVSAQQPTPAPKPTAVPAPTSAPKPTPAAPVKTAAPAPAPARTAAAVSSWRAQLGAFSVESNARSLWSSLERKYPVVAARQSHLVKSGNLTRLQAGGFASKAEAESFCATVKKGGQPCLVVNK